MGTHETINHPKNGLNCPSCPLKNGGSVSECCMGLRAVLRQAYQHTMSAIPPLEKSTD
jgi:hypothetical protein